LLGSTVTQAVLEEYQSAPISERLRATLRFLEKITLRPDEVTPSDVLCARDAGVSVRALREALYVCALFNAIVRIADTLNFSLGTGDGSWFLVHIGYRL
jgi:alkylhydroperoxidase family enzyme